MYANYRLIAHSTYKGENIDCCIELDILFLAKLMPK